MRVSAEGADVSGVDSVNLHDVRKSWGSEEVSRTAKITSVRTL